MTQRTETGYSPPIESRADLIAVFAAGEKAPEAWRIGTEHEKFVYRCADKRAPAYDERGGIRDLLLGLTEFGWQPIVENGNVIALKGEDGAVSLEPAGQFELSGAPLENLHQSCAEAARHLGQCKIIGDRLGLGFLGVGMWPDKTRAELPIMPKGRYKIMLDYMPKVGTLGLDMMLRTCTIQVNLDYSSEADMVKKFRVGLALQPVATALFANSPFTEGKPNGFVSFRSEIWRDTDNQRAGMLPFVFEPGMGFERYADYALDVPMYFIKRGDRYIDVSGKPFRDHLAGRLIPGERATISDWANHVSTIFPEVRLKRYIEMRGSDGGPWRRLPSLPAFWVGLIYDDTSLDACWEIVKDWTAAERQKLRDDVPTLGFKATIRGRSLLEISRQTLTLAEQGLVRRNKVDKNGRDESGYLRPLQEIAARGITPAEELLEKYRNAWKGSVEPIFDEYAY
ncbi:MAG: glutamate--cysteine ligase [Sphingomicrobium sp.]